MKNSLIVSNVREIVFRSNIFPKPAGEIIKFITKAISDHPTANNIIINIKFNKADVSDSKINFLTNIYTEKIICNMKIIAIIMIS